MPATDTIRLGIVGCVGRGGSFRKSIEVIDTLELTALCDINEEGLQKAADELGVKNTFTDFDALLDSGTVDAVVVGTPMPLHVPQSIAALEHGIHVISEVPAGVSIEECKQLVEATKKSNALYMMAENYTYAKPVQVVREMVRRGEFGDIYYAEGEYLHELKELNEITKWRRKWQTGVNGITYGTHSLGPILQWFDGQRVTQVCCAGSGHHYTDPRGDQYEAEDTSVMLCKLDGGGLVKIRVDMLSNRPHAMNNHQLQGTDGAFESSRAPGEPHRVWLKSMDEKAKSWKAMEEIWDQFMPDHWARFEDLAAKAGHGGGDLLELIDFSDAVMGIRACPIGIHEAMDMTLPGLVSQQSIEQGGQWIDVPNSRDW